MYGVKDLRSNSLDAIFLPLEKVSVGVMDAEPPLSDTDAVLPRKKEYPSDDFSEAFRRFLEQGPEPEEVICVAKINIETASMAERKRRVRAQADCDE